jgi:hypothetical protein
MMDMVLEDNNFSFNGKHYVQTIRLLHPYKTLSNYLVMVDL